VAAGLEVRLGLCTHTQADHMGLAPQLQVYSRVHKQVIV
jgi:hypothetical protein